MGNGRAIVDDRLRWLAVAGGVLVLAICACHIVASQPLHLVSPGHFTRVVAVMAPAPLVSLIMASMSPAASSDDISPILEWGMLFGSSVGAVAPFVNWYIALGLPNAAACHQVTMLPGFFMVLACFSVPFFGMRNSLYFWPAHRFSMITSGVLQLIRVMAQAHALRLANAAAALGLSELLPISLAAQCQAHPSFQPGGISQPAALSFGCVALLTGLVLTPSMRTRLAILSGRFGSPAARVLNLGELGSDELEPRAAPPVSFPGKAPRPHHQGGGQQVRHRRAATSPKPPPPPHGNRTTTATATVTTRPRPPSASQPPNGQKSVIFSNGGGDAIESLHETTSSMTDGELELELCRQPYFREEEVVDPFLRHRGSPDDGDGDNVESLHETMSSKSAHSELDRALRHGQDGANGHLSLQTHQVRRSSALSASVPLSEPVSLPPAPPSSASLSASAQDEVRLVEQDEVRLVERLVSGVSVEMVELELAAMIDDDVAEAIDTEMLDVIERAVMPPPPPPPTRESAPVIGQLDAFAEVAKSWYGALSQLMKESATGRNKPVDERNIATRPDQSERKRHRSETGAAVAEGSSLLHSGDGSHMAASPSADLSPSDIMSAVRPFGGKPHPNPLLVKPHPTHPIPGLMTATSPGKPQPACAGEPGPGPHTEIAAGWSGASDSERNSSVRTDSERNSSVRTEEAPDHPPAANHGGTCEIEESQPQRVSERSRRAPQSVAPSVGKGAATALTEAGKPAKRKKPQRSCAECGTTETPKWRCNGTLCNACGLKYPMEVVRPTTFGRAMELLQPALFSSQQPFHAPQFPWSAKPRDRVALPLVPGK